MNIIPPISTKYVAEHVPHPDWRWTLLTSVAKLESGHTPSRRRPEYWSGDIPWLSLKDIKGLDSRYIRDTMDKPTVLGIENSSARLLSPGTVALCRTASVGKVVILGREMATSQDFANWVCGPKLDPEYLYWAIQCSSSTFKLEKQGSTHKTIYMPVLERLNVLLPPLEEQRRIAAILDKADAIRRKRQKAIALTEQLLRSTFLEMFGDPVTNPKGWPTCPLGTIASFTGGGTPSRGESRYFQGTICWATAKDMKGEELTGTKEHITEEAIMKSATKLVPPETLLVVVKSKVLMHRLPVVMTTVPTCFGQDLKGIALHSHEERLYVARHLRLGQEPLLWRARGANTEGLTLEHLSEYSMMRPPRARVLEYCQSETSITQTLRQQRSALGRADTLFNSLTQQAFTGQL